jgi:hypothetical protein
MRLPNGWLCDERWGVGGRLRSKEEASVEFRLWFWSYRCPDVKISLKKNLKQESILTSNQKSQIIAFNKVYDR